MPADHSVARALARRLGPVGVWTFTVERQSAAAAREFAREIEAVGYPALWIPESLGSKEVFSHASLLLAATSTLVVASGIANIWARDAVAMANGARTLADAFPGRFVLGIGVSHAPAVAMRGSTYERPIEHMREYLAAMEKAPYVGAPPAQPAAVVLAALGPRMLRLARDHAAGAHPYFVPVEHTTIARKELGGGPLLAVEQAAVLERDVEKARALARKHMKRYLGLDNYANNLKRLGWSDADFANGGSDALVDAIVVHGDERAIRACVDDHLARGADHVCVQVLAGDLAAPPIAELRALAPALLRLSSLAGLQRQANSS